jgi:hypothetical protein
VYTRHSSDCPRASDKNWTRCRCPKWIWGTLPNGDFVRRSAKTRTWEQAEEFRRELEAEADALRPSPFLSPTAPVTAEALAITIAHPPQKPRVTIEFAIEKYLADAKSLGLEKSTLSKLATIFRKQLLPWAQGEGLTFLDELDLDAVKNFRATWEDGPLAKAKKQERVVGFFWSCVRRGYIVQNPCLDLGKIKVNKIPTDYFPQDEFAKIIDTTYVYGDPRGGFIPLEDLRLRLRVMTWLLERQW